MTRPLSKHWRIRMYHRYVRLATFIQVMYRRVRNHHDRASFDHDTGLASRIGSYPEADVAQVDAWYEERARGMDRRVSMVFGREVAILGLLITVLSGKAQEASNAIVNFLAPLFRTTPTHVVEAMVVALILLIVGAFGVKSHVARCTYIRYLIRLSAFRRGRQDCAANPVATPRPALESLTIQPFAALKELRKVSVSQPEEHS
jgi:hypothetical protein